MNRLHIHPTKLKSWALIAFILLTMFSFVPRRTKQSLPFWRYLSLTAPNGTTADLEQSMRSALGTDHAAFTYLGPRQLGITSFGNTPDIAMALSARLEAFA